MRRAELTISFRLFSIRLTASFFEHRASGSEFGTEAKQAKRVPTRAEDSFKWQKTNPNIRKASPTFPSDFFTSVATSSRRLPSSSSSCLCFESYSLRLSMAATWWNSGIWHFLVRYCCSSSSSRKQRLRAYRHLAHESVEHRHNVHTSTKRANNRPITPRRFIVLLVVHFLKKRSIK